MLALKFLTAGFIIGLLAGRVEESVHYLILQIVSFDSFLTAGLFVLYYGLMENCGANFCANNVFTKYRQYKITVLPLLCLATYAVNTVVTSALACVCVVYLAVVPFLNGIGLKREFGAAAVIAGSWGSVLSSKTIHNKIIADIALCNVEEVIDGHKTAALLGVMIIALLLFVILSFCERDMQKQNSMIDKNCSKNIMLPFMPLVLTVIFYSYYPNTELWYMLLILCLVVGLVLKNNNYNILNYKINLLAKVISTLGLLVTVQFLAFNLDLMGITQALNKFTSPFQAYISSLLLGSGDAAVINYTSLIIPWIQEAGANVQLMASAAYLSAALGRAASPFSAVIIVCAELTESSIFRLTAVNLLPTLAGAAGVVLLLQ